VARTPLTPRDRQLIQELMEQGSRVLGLRLCLHDLIQRSGLPKCWLQHENEACMAVKQDRQTECAAFCGKRIEGAIASQPDGSIHVCPFGHTDIAAPVWLGGTLAGVLYASACWEKREPPPRDGLVIHPPRQWLEDRRGLLVALARKLEALLQGGVETPERSRRERILAYLDQSLDQALRLEDLARYLNLSGSRTGHLVKDLFDETFPQLVTRLRLTRGARYLSVTDMPVSAIAAETGFTDQSHFTRAFRSRYHTTPLQYRRAYRVGV